MCVPVQGGRGSKCGPRLDVNVCETQTAKLFVGHQLMVSEGGASILKATGRRRDRWLGWLEHFRGCLLVGPIRWLVLVVCQSEKCIIFNRTVSSRFTCRDIKKYIFVKLLVKL